MANTVIPGHNSVDGSLKTTTHFYLIRHGQTDRNAAGKEIQGWIDDQDAQLNANGIEQAKTLGKNLQAADPKGFIAIYSSPLKRCMVTARAINEFFNLPLTEHRGFMEICHGQHDTMSYAQRNEEGLKFYKEMEQAFEVQNPGKTPDRFFKWKVNPLSQKAIPPERMENPFEGELETIFQVYERVTAALKEIAKKHQSEIADNPSQNKILVITSNAAIKTVVDEAEYRERGDLSPLPVYYEKPKAGTSRLLPNCAVYHFELDEKGELFFRGPVDLAEKLDQKI